MSLIISGPSQAVAVSRVATVHRGVCTSTARSRRPVIRQWAQDGGYEGNI